MRANLELVVCAEKPFSLCFGRGRTGWLFTSHLPLQVVRSRLGNWCSRVTVVHGPSGRYFAQPSARYFRRALRSIELIDFFTPERKERLRRLRPFLAASGRGPEQACFVRMALRMDALSVATQRQTKLEDYLGQEFDEAWGCLPLYHSSAFGVVGRTFLMALAKSL